MNHSNTAPSKGKPAGYLSTNFAEHEVPVAAAKLVDAAIALRVKGLAPGPPESDCRKGIVWERAALSRHRDRTLALHQRR